MINLSSKFDNYIYRFPYRKYMYKHKCIFIHIPKAAGTSIRKALGAPIKPRDHYDYKMYLNSHSGKFDSYFKFCFVRNPWSRLYSVYNYLSRGGNQTTDLLFCKKNEVHLKDFKSFATMFLTHSNVNKMTLLGTQSSFIFDENDNLMVDYVGKMENIQEGFDIVKKKLKLTSILENLNTSPDNDFRSKYDSELVDLVSQVYFDDVKNFDYTFE